MGAVRIVSEGGKFEIVNTGLTIVPK